ncbi:MAG TPA: FAD-dependent oxidoreductase [Nocardioidaceae bacterium]|nr:FAD-dependent oxidoreductase [Nocardioidaceae bacterium]
MTVEKLVVVGASLAGLRAVESARKQGFEGSITLIGAEPHLPYDRPPLSKAFLERKEGQDSQEFVEFRSDETFRDELNVELVLGAPATSLDTVTRTVYVGERAIPYDALVIATGAHARMIPGFEGLSGVHVLRTIDDAVSIRSAIEAGARTVVIGAGFIGSEIASSAKKMGSDVTVVEALPVPLVRAIGEQMGATVAQLHELNGTHLICGVTVTSVEGDGHVERVHLSDGTVLDADLVIVGAGAVPNVAWLEGSGLVLENGIVCDEYLFTGIDGVYAAGDIAHWPNPQFEGSRMRMENWTAAAEQGAVAAHNAVGLSEPKPYKTVPYFWSDWYGSRIQFVGITDADDIDVVENSIETDGRVIALYRKGDAFVGALTVNRQTEIMKLRGLIMKGVTIDEAHAFVAARLEALAAKAAATD